MSPVLETPIRAFVCDAHGLAWASAEEAHAHDRECGVVRALSLEELQRQMDEATEMLDRHELAVSHARSSIAQASADHRHARLQRDGAKERADLARRLWAERAQIAAKAILSERAR